MAVVWSHELYPAFGRELVAVFRRIDAVAAARLHRVRRALDYTVYVGRRQDGDVPVGGE